MMERRRCRVSAATPPGPPRFLPCAQAAGGALAGALVLGVKHRSPPAALVGALLFSVAAAGPDVLAMMNATPAEFDAKTPSAAHVSAASPAAFAADSARGASRLA